MPQKPQPDQCGQDIVSPTEGVDVTAQEKQAAHESYFHRDAVALDQDINVDTGGQLDETISSRVRRVSNAHPKWGWNPGVWLAKTLNAGLNLLQKNHGAKAQAGDLERAQAVEKTEDQALGIGGQKQGSIGAKNRRIG